MGSWGTFYISSEHVIAVIFWACGAVICGLNYSRLRVFLCLTAAWEVLKSVYDG